MDGGNRSVGSHGPGAPVRLRRQKAYKARDPYDTIEHARAVLDSCDLSVIETHHTHAEAGVHFCRLTLGDEDIRALSIGVNGKGLDARWALASAYGEFMERLQNGVLLPQRQSRFATARYWQSSPDVGSTLHKRLRERDLILDHLYAPDEVYLESGQVVAECGDVLTHMLRVSGGALLAEYLHGVSGGEPIPCLPFCSLTLGRVRPIPAEMLRLTCASNGMCAGNTSSEALVQGLSEVVERYVVRRLQLDGAVPPSVPIEYFAGTVVHDRLRRLQESMGITAIVKDCSLGEGLPALGLLLVDRERGRWAFHIGADPSPITALERCLTEVYQGDRHAVAGRFHPLPGQEAGAGPDGRGGPSEDALTERRAAYYEAIVYGSGRYPAAILGGEPGYDFAGFEHPLSISDEDDLRYLVDKVSDLGFDVHIRDVSALGFPAFQVYVPGMSENDHWMTAAERYSFMQVLSHVRTLLDLRRADRSARERLAVALSTALARNTPSTLQPSRWFLSHDSEDLRRLGADELLARLRLSLGESGPATASSGRSGAAVWGPGSADAASEQAWAGLPLPTCFDCGVCPLEPSCRYIAMIGRVRKVQERQRDRFPDQSAVATLL